MINKDLLKKLPDNPGIYLFYNSSKELIYVGKATSLRNRVRSYFDDRPQTTDYRRPIEVLIHEVEHISFIQTDSVLEAIILEGEYIKKYRPKYNVDWRDDKSWNYIGITKDKFPRVITIRAHEKNNFKFQISNFKFLFGPYPGVNTREMMKMLRKLFFISVCEPCEPGKPCRPCLYYQLGQCLGVCTGEISSQQYKKKVIRPLTIFLSGRKKSLLKKLKKEMKEAAKKHEFEEAGRLRDQVRALEHIQDIALLNKEFISYNVTRNTYQNDFEKNTKMVRDTRYMSRVEGYDISNTGANEKVGSMIVFENGEPKKSDYRKFIIRSVLGQSDVDSLGEVMQRRLKHSKDTEYADSYADDADNADKYYWPLPNVILIDGGKPQVNAVNKILKYYNINNIPVVGIAKGPQRKRNDIVLGNKEKDFVKWVNENKELLIKVRDEAHRFAITFHRKRRNKIS